MSSRSQHVISLHFKKQPQVYRSILSTRNIINYAKRRKGNEGNLFIRQISRKTLTDIIYFSGGHQVVLSDEAQKAKIYRIPPGKTNNEIK